MDSIPTNQLPPSIQEALMQNHWIMLPNGNRQIQMVLPQHTIQFVSPWTLMAAQTQANRQVFLNFRRLASAVLEYTKPTTLTLTQAPNVAAFLVHAKEVLPPNLVPECRQSDTQQAVQQWAQRVTAQTSQTRPAMAHEIG